MFIGEVDHGKSTLIGRLILETNSAPRNTLKEIKNISRQLGQESSLAFLVDQLKEEREHLLTIDTTQFFLKHTKNNFLLIDTPGHAEFIKNMLTGTSHADTAVLVIDASCGPTTQTAQHLYLLNMFGIENIAVAVNKMDLVEYNQGKFDHICQKLSSLSKSLHLNHCSYIPLSAKESINIAQKSRRIPWYQGPTLFDFLHNLPRTKDENSRPLRCFIQDSYHINGEHVAVGKIVSGTLKEGQDVFLSPHGEKIKVASIKAFGQCKTTAYPQECLGFTSLPSFPIERGSVISDTGKPLHPSRHFRSRIFWLSEKNLKAGEKVQISCVTQDVTGTVDEIEKIIHPSSSPKDEGAAAELKQNHIGIVTLKTEQPMIFESFDITKELGRFTLNKDSQCLGFGTILDPLISHDISA